MKTPLVKTCSCRCDTFPGLAQEKGGPTWKPTALVIALNELAYANSSLMTLPLLAIFIGRPFLLVNVVVSEIPNA